VKEAPAFSAALQPFPPGRAADLIRQFPHAAILVVGDVMLDQFLVGRVNRISPEAPVPVVEFEREERRIGGAGNVAHNVCALGGTAELVAITGVDAEASLLLDVLRAGRIGTGGVVAHASRMTTRKMRIVTTRNQQVARVDYETDADVSGDPERLLIAEAMKRAPASGAIIVSDYLKGAVTSALMVALADAARERRIPLLVDPKIPHLTRYKGATLVTPNHHDADPVCRRGPPRRARVS
jgi:rfaE bifunctional protein kinase chain/domain